ncbi:gem-associated protein 4-like [Branchiostoma floridae]|uniref:Gem-associated protein 4-like n=1 Tax=Branchiostoma floridae TaxID=7739 RepID=A0A9J7LLY7_BRAFL|nr:gem-associated protein 4-like [Branchiostoma floridae]
MVYTQEIAVLHSAFVLAEQQSPTPLHDLDRPSAKVTASQLLSACEEIVSGLETNHKQFQQEHWSYKLTAILLEKVLDGQQAKQGSYLYPICSILPRISKALFFELLKALKWGKWLSQCLMQIPTLVATSLLKDLSTHVQLGPDDSDSSLLASICQSLLTPSILDQSPSTQQGVHQSEETISPEREQTEAVLITTLFQELHSLIPLFGKEEQRLKLVSSCLLYVCKKLKKKKPTELSICNGNITRQIPSKCEQLRKTLPTDMQFLTDRKNLKKLATRIDKMQAKDLQTDCAKDIDGVTNTGSCVPLLVEFLHKVLTKHHWLDNLDLGIADSELAQVAIMQSTVDCLLSICERDTKDSRTTGLYTFVREVCAVLQLCAGRWKKSMPLDTTLETVATAIRDEKGGIQIQTAVQKMNEKLDGYEDCLDWMLNNSEELYKDPRWIEALERNVDILGTSRIVLSIAEIIHTLRVKHPQDAVVPEVLRRLRKVLTAAYTQLPLRSQDAVLRQVLTAYRPGLLCSGPFQEGIDDDVITAFNRMVLSGEGQDGVEVFSTMCGVALQAPLLLLLQVLPALCTWRPDPDSSTLLCTTLHDAAGDLHPNTREENNFVNFVENLLRPYKPPFDLTCPFLYTPLLSAPDFAPLAVFPYIYQHYGQEQHVPPTTALKLLQVVLQDQGSDNHWLQPQQVFPIILCLCQLLDDTSALWEEVDGDESISRTAQIRTLTLTALKKIQHILLELLSSESSKYEKLIAWLHKKLQLLDWTCRLHVFPLLQLGLPQLKKEAPDVMFTICNLPKTDWLPLSDTLYAPGTGLVAMLECCRISAEMAQLMTETVTVDVEDASQLVLFQKGLTVALTQVLPQCVWQEWCHVIQALQQLIRDGLVVLPGQQGKHFQGLEDALQVELSTSQQLSEVLQLMASPWTETWVTPSVWVHVVKNYVATIQELQQSVIQSDSPPEAQLPLIGQLFCHCCSVITVAPGEVCQQLFVLALDMLTMCQSLSTSANEEVALREKEVLREEIAGLELYGGLKRTLQLKLDGIGQI